jgi:predicted dehydrogenase
MTRLLVIGAGSIGSRHAANAKALGVESIAITDPDVARREQLAASTGATAFATLDEALASWQPTAAIVCPPPSMHIESALACARAGCDLLIEKPLSATNAGVDALEAVIENRGLRAAVAYQLRFHPAVRRMRELIRSGSIGALLSIQAEYGQYLPAWRPARDYRETYTAQAALGGGILLDASHEIDYVRWLAGEMTAVYASVARLSDLEMDVEDTAALIVRFQSPAIGEIHLDCVQRGYSRRCVLIGSDATVRWDAMSGLSLTSKDGATTIEALVPQPNHTYVAELKAFLDGDLSHHASVADGRRVVDIILAARESTAARSEIAV